jgi:hypothetical protein
MFFGLLEFTPVNKVLAYCGFLQNPELSLPATGVNGAAVHAMKEAELGFLWSEVEWPFQPRAMQHNAVQFHQVVTHMFGQGAVVPFRLLSMFDDQSALAALVARHQSDFVADLERLRGFVQMECVVYRQGVRPVADSAAANAHLQPRAAIERSIGPYVVSLRSALAGVSPEVRTRELRSGSRIFALVERGREHVFHACVESVAVPEHFLRRTSGPRPASEFLSAPAKAPTLAEAK